MKTLDGFGDVFFIVKEKPRVLIPAIFGVVVVGIMNFVIFGYFGMLKLSVTWMPFALTVFKWSLIFTLSAWSALLIAYDDPKVEKIFSKSFVSLFTLSTFMAFFVVWGLDLYVIPGFFVLFLMEYAPCHMILSGSTDSLEAFKGNMRFILEDSHVIHTIVSLFILVTLFAIPYVGEYLAAFFYVLWIPNIYVSEKRRMENEEEVNIW